MVSRYSYMIQGKYKNGNGEYFPDPTTLNYNVLEAKNISTVEITELTCQKLWTVLPKLFDIYELDDILLSVNGVAHRNFLKPGDVLFAPSREDIESSYGS